LQPLSRYCRFFLSNPSGRSSIIVVYGPDSHIAVVRRLSSLVEVVVDHEVAIAGCCVYSYAVSLLGSSSALPHSITLDVVVVAFKVKIDAVVGVVR